MCAKAGAMAQAQYDAGITASVWPSEADQTRLAAQPPLQAA